MSSSSFHCRTFSLGTSTVYAAEGGVLPGGARPFSCESRIRWHAPVQTAEEELGEVAADRLRVFAPPQPDMIKQDIARRMAARVMRPLPCRPQTDPRRPRPPLAAWARALFGNPRASRPVGR